jgi:hypothetical protein
VAVIAVLATAGAAVAVLRDDNDSSTSPPEGLTLDDLEPALLTADDVGGDFLIDESGGDRDDGAVTDELFDPDQLETSEECRAAIQATAAVAQQDDEISVEFASASEGTLEQTISLAASGEATLAEVRTAVEQCDAPIVVSDDDMTGEVRLITSDVDGLGDLAFGLTIAFDVQVAGMSVGLEVYGVLWVRDGVQAALSGFGGFDDTTFEPVPIDPDRIEELARLSDERIARIASA